ncbi:MAG: T9SS type A sorting domain-containing protein [Flavobacteriales bacterium]
MKKPVLILTFLATSLFASAQANNYANGSTVANFTVTDINGNTHSLYDYTSQGKYVLLDFFFAACGPCQQTAPYFNQLHETYGCNSADLICLTINNGNDNDAQVLAYENTYGGTYAHSPAVSNTGGGPAVTSTFGVGAFPTYCLIGPDNKMVKNDMWPISSMQSFVNYLPPAIQPAACATSVPEISGTRNISIYPSPSTGVVTVELDGMGSGNVTLELFDMLGQQVRSLSLGTATSGALRQNVDLGDLEDGQYLCRLITKDGRRDVRRLVIAH